jgi:Peptidase C13 family
VITAADSEHSSFGCQDKVKWTYFGDAFFNTALRHTADLRQAFAEARAIVRQRELHYHLVPSNPQIAGGKNIDVLLRKTSSAEAFGRQP